MSGTGQGWSAEEAAAFHEAFTAHGQDFDKVRNPLCSTRTQDSGHVRFPTLQHLACLWPPPASRF